MDPCFFYPLIPIVRRKQDKWIQMESNGNICLDHLLIFRIPDQPEMSGSTRVRRAE